MILSNYHVTVLCLNFTIYKTEITICTSQSCFQIIWYNVCEISPWCWAQNKELQNFTQGLIINNISHGKRRKKLLKCEFPLPEDIHIKKKISLRLMSKTLQPTFYSRSLWFQVLHYSPLIHSEYTFMHGIWKQSSLIFLYVTV